MPEYEKTSEQTAASAITTADEFVGVQSSETVLYTGTQVGAFVGADTTTLTSIAAASQLTTAFQALSTGITDTVQITGEYMFTEDHEKNYTASFSDGMSAQTVTFTELPADTVGIWVFSNIADTRDSPDLKWRRTSGGTLGLEREFHFADGGTNVVQGLHWMPTGGNSIYVVSMEADSASTFYIMGYKTGA